MADVAPGGGGGGGPLPDDDRVERLAGKGREDREKTRAQGAKEVRTAS